MSMNTTVRSSVGQFYPWIPRYTSQADVHIRERYVFEVGIIIYEHKSTLLKRIFLSTNSTLLKQVSLSTNSTLLKRVSLSTNSTLLKRVSLSTNSTLLKRLSLSTNSTLLKRVSLSTNSTFLKRVFLSTNSTLLKRVFLSRNSTLLKRVFLSTNSTLLKRVFLSTNTAIRSHDMLLHEYGQLNNSHRHPLGFACIQVSGVRITFACRAVADGIVKAATDAVDTPHSQATEQQSVKNCVEWLRCVPDQSRAIQNGKASAGVECDSNRFKSTVPVAEIKIPSADNPDLRKVPSLRPCNSFFFFFFFFFFLPLL